MAWQGLGVVRSDDLAGEGRVGQVLAIGMGRWIGQVGGAGQRETVNDR